MTKTRQVDEIGNVSYAIANDDGTEAGTIAKTCSGWAVMLPDSHAPVASIKAGMEWLALRASILTRPAVTA